MAIMIGNQAAMQAIEDRLVAWATERPDIRAALVVGSRGRVDHPADTWSDLDVVLVSTEPEWYLQSADWLNSIGEPWLTFVETTPIGGTKERRVVFAGGYDVDFAIFSLDLFSQILDADLRIIAGRGVRILLDKDGMLTRIAVAVTAFPATASAPPAQQECLQIVRDFWHHAFWAAKKLRRGELFIAKARCDERLKHLLLRIVTWHAQATHNWVYDTWHSGRFLDEWADPRIVARLHHAYAHYDAADIRRALLATMDLFRLVAQEVTASLDYQYPTEEDAHIVALVASVLPA
jgi:aminoglycoside 6-adenylyltransferase